MGGESLAHRSGVGAGGAGRAGRRGLCVGWGIHPRRHADGEHMAGAVPLPEHAGRWTRRHIARGGVPGERLRPCCHLRSVRCHRNKAKATLSARIDRMQRGSKARILRRLDNQLEDILHKQTTHLVSTLHRRSVQTVMIGDVRDIRRDLGYGAKANQKLHRWAHGKVRWMLTYKAERRGMCAVLVDERYTTRTCTACGTRHKPKGRDYRCTCGFAYQRNGVGAWNIRQKYTGAIPVVGAMIPPIGVRYATPRNTLRRETPGFSRGEYQMALGLPIAPFLSQSDHNRCLVR